MKKHIIIALAVAATLSGCNKEEAQEAPAAVTLDTLEQKVSYAVGYNMARRMKADGFDLDATVLKYAIDHHNAGNESELSDEEINAAMTAFQTQLQEKQQAAFSQQADENLKRSQEFLAANGKREGVVTTESGLQYEVVEAGTGDAPKPEDYVTVNYKGKSMTGEVFDQGEDVSFQVNQLIPGWVEALPLMKVGAKWNLYIPADLAYGPGGTGNIGPNSALVFEMQLLSIGEPEVAE
ncbi:MAG: FKBP-type peptidyl-prolyl cis-trans isomerase [Agarilytica sp.]